MNIGFDAKRALFNRSGLGNYSRSTLSLLSHFYPDNKFYLFSPKNNKDLFQSTENQFIVVPEPGIPTHLSSIWRIWGIHRQIKNQKLDIYHGLSNELPWSIKKTGVKAVVTIHDLIFLRFPEYYPFIDRQIYSLKFRHACRVADKIIAISEATKTDIITFLGIDPKKIEVVYQTCDPVFRILLDDDKKELVRKKYNLPGKYILYLGTIEKRKNALTLIKAYLNANAEIPLLIAGRPTEYLSEINEFLELNPVGDRIIFRHNIESVDLPALYQSATLFVYPSVFEGFGIPILEALYSGVPVITSTGSCFAETGGDAALYCDPYNVDQMSECISKVLNDPYTRKSMIERGFAHAGKFDEANVASNLMKVYRNL
ncbi:MAG: glycosyltransferase family 1 protein [Bacteroidales bacterium]|nr:glycosyltransferase family 1 protein [Bacteroidales bacterium]